MKENYHLKIIKNNLSLWIFVSISSILLIFSFFLTKSMIGKVAIPIAVLFGLIWPLVYAFLLRNKYTKISSEENFIIFVFIAVSIIFTISRLISLNKLEIGMEGIILVPLGVISGLMLLIQLPLFESNKHFYTAKTPSTIGTTWFRDLLILLNGIMVGLLF